jgi:deoxyinosine 3'endonuclease (endonuclease V)
MLRLLRTHRSRFALATLAAFLLAQPAVGCAALCLIERHVAGRHVMTDMNHGTKVLTNSACHPTATGAVQQAPLQVLSPMEPASAPILAVAPDRWVEPARSLPTTPRLISPTVEPPPPRLV